MRNQKQNTIIYNATNDFTDRDKVAFQYRLLIANQFKNDAERMENEQTEAFDACVRVAIRDLTVWLAVIVFFALAIVVAVQW